MVNYPEYLGYYEDDRWWKEDGDMKNNGKEKSPIEEKESIKEEKKEENSASIENVMCKACESDKNPYSEETKLPSGKSVVVKAPGDKEVKDYMTSYDSELFYNSDYMKKMWEEVKPKTLDGVAGAEESKEKAKKTDYILGAKDSRVYSAYHKVKPLDEVVIDVEESKEKAKKTDYMLGVKKGEFLGVKDDGYPKWDNDSQDLFSQVSKKSYTPKESYSDIIKEKEDEIDNLWTKLRTAEKRKTSLQIENSKWISEYRKTIQEKTRLEEENKMLKDKLFLIERDPVEYKRRKEVDPFDEENWEENGT